MRVSIDLPMPVPLMFISPPLLALFGWLFFLCDFYVSACACLCTISLLRPRPPPPLFLVPSAWVCFAIWIVDHIQGPSLVNAGTGCGATGERKSETRVSLFDVNT